MTVTPNGNGNIVFSSDADTGVRIGSSSNTPAVLSVSGQIGNNAALIVNNLNANSGTGDLIAASSAGATKFVVNSTGNIQFGGNSSTINTLTVGGTGGRTFTFPDASGTVCLNTNNCGYALGTNYWQINSNAISPANSTYDLLLGSTSTGSAKFAFYNVAGGTPTASISAGITANNTYLTGAGNLATTNKQSRLS